MLIRIYSSASIAENPMLAVVFRFSDFVSVLMKGEFIIDEVINLFFSIEGYSERSVFKLCGYLGFINLSQNFPEINNLIFSDLKLLFLRKKVKYVYMVYYILNLGKVFNVVNIFPLIETF